MVALKRLFQPEKGLGGQEIGTSDVRHNMTNSQFDPCVAASSRPSPSSHAKVARAVEEPLDVERHFQRIERQLEELHSNLQKQPTSPRSQIPSRTSSRLTSRNPRHVDLLDAVFSSSKRQQAESPDKSSPVSRYNEDVAERNITRFLERPSRRRNLYSRVISAIYQEDAADKNITKKKEDIRPRPANTRLQSVSSRSSKPSTEGHERDNSGRSDMTKENKTAALAPQQASRPRSRTRGDGPTTPSQSRDTPRLREQRSAPNLSTKKTSTPPNDPGPVGHLSIPPAYKQGDAWSSAPFPDSPTLPILVAHDKSVKGNEPAHEIRLTEQTPPPTACNYSLPKRPTPRKNIRALSINTELAAQGKPAKPAHRAIQPPTPSSHDAKYNPSIAEVMNSPLPPGTPSSISPLPSSNAKVAEIMDMFKRAYTTTPAMSPHPTFETLQDAIVREVNSHEAFERVPAPEQGPPFTPSPTKQSFDRSTTTPKISGRRGSGKENQLSKLIKPGSFRKHRRSSETRRSISTTGAPSKVFSRVTTSSSRRRHTDAPPPSPGFFDATEPAQQRKQMPYSDLPLRSQTVSPVSASNKRSFSLSKHLDHSQSVGTIATPSVYYMRAQTSPTSSDDHTSFSSNDCDDDVLQLPSPTTMPAPRIQLHGKDKNHVKYTTNGTTTPANAFRLMNWQQPSRRNVISKGNITLTGASPSPYTTNSGNWTRSVETC